MAVIRFHSDAAGRVMTCSGCAQCASRTRFGSAHAAGRPTAFLATAKPAVPRSVRRVTGRVRERAGDGMHWNRDGLIADAPTRTVWVIETAVSERDEPGQSAAINAAMWPRKWKKSGAGPFTPTALSPAVNLLPQRGTLRDTARVMTEAQSADGGN